MVSATEQHGHDWAVGFDVGGTKIEASLVREDGTIGESLRVPSPATREATLRVIEEMARKLAKARPICGFGLGIPGTIDPKTGILRNAPNSPAINGTAFEADLVERLPGPVLLDNDANCLALSEHRFGAARGRDNVVAIILGTGVGVGVILDGRLLPSPRRLAPEPGHLPLNCWGRACACGNRGCVEAYLSGPSILGRYHEAGGDPRVTDTQTVFARTSDPLAKGVLDETRMLFSRFVAGLVSVYDPDIVILGGGVSQQPLFRESRDEVARAIFGSREAPPIVGALFGASSGKLGAACLVFDQS